MEDLLRQDDKFPLRPDALVADAPYIYYPYPSYMQLGPSIVYAPLRLGFRVRVMVRVKVRSVISVSCRVRVRVRVSADIW